MDNMIVAVWEKHPYFTNKQLANHPEIRCSESKVSKTLQAAGINKHLRLLAKRRDRMWRNLCTGNPSALTAVLVIAKLQRMDCHREDIADHLGLTVEQALQFQITFAKELGWDA